VYEYYADKSIPDGDIDWSMGAMPQKLTEFFDHTKVSQAKPFPPRLWFMALYLDVDEAAKIYMRLDGTQPYSSATSSTNPSKLVSVAELELLGTSVQKEVKPVRPPLVQRKKTWAEIDAESAQIARGAPEGLSLASSAVSTPTVERKLAGLIPPDVRRRLIKKARMDKQSAIHLREKQARWAKQKASMAKFQHRHKDELELDEEYQEAVEQLDDYSLQQDAAELEHYSAEQQFAEELAKVRKEYHIDLDDPLFDEEIVDELEEKFGTFEMPDDEPDFGLSRDDAIP
jgi:hypothetical protein